MNHLLESIKNEKRENLGKRFNRWIDFQWGYEKGSSPGFKSKKWRVDELRAVKEITESILLDTRKCYFVYEDNKLICLPDEPHYSTRTQLEIDTSVFKELLRDFKLKILLNEEENKYYLPNL